METMPSSGIKLRSKIRSKKKRNREKSPSPSPTSSSFRSSSPNLSVKHGKAVYVRTLNIRHQQEWYSFEFNGSGDEDEKRKTGPRGYGDRVPVLTPFYGNEISLYSSCAAVDSTIYYVGGKSERSPYRRLDMVRGFDTSRPEQPWKKAPSMLNARESSAVVALNGKIYVMGGNADCDLIPWGEVFDPESNMWVPLGSPLPKPTAAAFCLFAAALYGRNEFVVGSTRDNFLHTYNVVTKRWEIFDNIKKSYLPFYLKPVAVGTTLYWFQEAKLRAYDLLTKWYCLVSINGLEKVMPLKKFDSSNTDYSPVLVHIAENEFLLVCLEHFDIEAFTQLHCIKICVSQYAGRGRKVSLNADVRSSQTYIMSMQTRILDAVLMDRGDSSSKEV